MMMMMMMYVFQRGKYYCKECVKIYLYFINNMGAKGDWDFRIFDLVKNPDGTDI